MNTLHFYRHNNTKRNILSNAAYFTATVKDADYKCVNYNLHDNNYLQRSVSADNVVIRSRGFKPSDRHDPAKKHFLENLTSKILHFDMEGGETKRIDLQKLLTPASDSNEHLQAKNKKMYASSYFYSPSHPTVEDQVELARRISHSLSDVRNLKSKGQSMYVNRKKRSVKWIHDGNGVEDEEEPSSPLHKDKIPLKCMMNPNGKVLDIHGIQALGEEVNIEETPSHPEKLFDIVRDLNNQKGRGAEIFAKRRKRSEKWVVDREPSQTPSTPGLPKIPIYPSKKEAEVKENSKLPMVEPFPPYTPTPITTVPEVEFKPFYNPFTLDLSLESVNPPANGNGYMHFAKTVDYSAKKNAENKKVQLREIAVGTDKDFPFANQRTVVAEHSKHISFDVPSNVRSPPPLNVIHPKKPVPQNIDNEITPPDNTPYEQQCEHFDGEENDYTPVPVKQLIREFEKTCRPVMQYKQISPKVTPQQCPLDNDILRYFKGCPAPKYEETVQKIAQSSTHLVNGNGSVRLDQTKNYYEHESAELYENRSVFSDDFDDYYREDPRQCNGDFVSFDEIGDTNYGPYDQMNGNRSVSLKDINDYYQQQAANEFYENGNGTKMANGHVTFANTEAEVPAEAKSMVLAMVASEEEILDTIRHLRNTPVLDNLIASASPDCKFTDIYPEVGNGLDENNQYQGPKLNSFQTLTNYNTAPRGWTQAHTYYRPVTFGKPQETIVYSDF